LAAESRSRFRSTNRYKATYKEPLNISKANL
jgi:hypothetical protein